MVLATSQNDRVAAWTISFIVWQGALYFQTDTKIHKAKQLAGNPYAAICWENIAISGRRVPLGHPASKGNGVREAFETLYPVSFQKYTMLATEQVYQFELLNARLWCYDDENMPYLETIDFEKTVDREKYNIAPKVT